MFFSFSKSKIRKLQAPATPGGRVRKAVVCGAISVFVQAPQGVQATEWVVPFVLSGPVETLTLRRLQEALLGDPLLPSPSSLHGEGLRGERGQQLQR